MKDRIRRLCLVYGGCIQVLRRVCVINSVTQRPAANVPPAARQFSCDISASLTLFCLWRLRHNDEQAHDMNCLSICSLAQYLSQRLY